MLTLADIRDWLKAFNASNNYYIGKLDNKQECSIGVYQYKSEQEPRIAIGGRELSGYDKKSVSILIHWNKNANETEKRAQYLYNQILKSGSVVIGDTPVQFVRLLNNEPIDVGTDDSGVYERVIQLEFYYALTIESE